MDTSTCIRAHMFTRALTLTRPHMFIPTSTDIMGGLIVIAGGTEGITHIANIKNIADTGETTTGDN